MADPPATRPNLANDSHRRKKRFTFSDLVVILLFLAALVVVTFPFPTRGPTPIAPRVECLNNLKQIELALRHYEQDYKSLPPAYTVDENGKPLHSWRTLILPYIGGQALYDRIDLSKPWDDPANVEVFQFGVSAYRCPNDSSPDNHTTYMAVVTSHGYIHPLHPRRLPDKPEQRYATLLVVEVDSRHAVPWMAPSDTDASFVFGFSPDSDLPHHGVLNAAFDNGSVKPISAKMSAAERRKMIPVAVDNAPPRKEGDAQNSKSENPQ